MGRTCQSRCGLPYLSDAIRGLGKCPVRRLTKTDIGIKKVIENELKISLCILGKLSFPGHALAAFSQA